MPSTKQAQNLKQKCRQRAQRQLMQRYREEFEVLYAAELEYEGIARQDVEVMKLRDRQIALHHRIVQYADLRAQNITVTSIRQVMDLHSWESDRFYKLWQSGAHEKPFTRLVPGRLQP